MDTRSLISEPQFEEEEEDDEEEEENEPRVPHPPLMLALDILELTQLCKLIKCIRDKDRRMIARLVEEGVPRLLDYTHPSEGETALGLAASYNDEHMVEYLLSLGANVNVVDLQGRTAAMRACEFGHVESLRILAEAGTDMSIVDEIGNGVLYYCIDVSNRHFACAEICIENGADVNNINFQGTPTFVIACETAATNEGLCLMFLRVGARSNLQDLNSRRTGIMAAAGSGSAKVVKAILDYGATNIDERMDRINSHACHDAAKNGHLEVLRVLAAYGADFNVQTDRAYCHALTPIHMAALVDSPAGALCCLFCGQRGTNAKLKNRDGLMPKQVAKEKMFKANVKACGQAMKFYPKKKPRKPPLWLIRMHDYIYYREDAMLEEFVKHDPDGICMVGRAEFWDILAEMKLPIPWYHGLEDEVKPPEFAELEKIVNKHDKGKGYIDYVTFLIGKKYIPKKLQMGSFNPKFKKEKKQKKSKLKANIPICQLPPIHRPVELVPKHHIWTDFCRFDRDHVPSNAFEDDSYWYMKMPGREATDMADRVRFGDSPTVSNAVKTIQGQPNFPNKYFKTPLMMAIMATDIDMVTYLVENGAAVNKRDNFLWTPLHLACHIGDPEIVQLLLKSGAKVIKVESLNKATPIMKAIESKSLEVVKLMMQKRADLRAEDRFEFQILELARDFADYDIFTAIQTRINQLPADKKKKKKKKKQKAIKFIVPLPQVKISLIPPDPEICSDLPLPHHRGRLLPPTKSIKRHFPPNENLAYWPYQVWTNRKCKEELIVDREKRRERFGWRVDLDDYKRPYWQNIADKVKAYEAAEAAKTNRPILKKKPAKAKKVKPPPPPLSDEEDFQLLLEHVPE